MFGYKWKMNDSTSVDSNQPQRTLREEIEYQMQQMEERERQQCLQPKEPEPDYSKMTLREELETRFKLLEERDRQQKLSQSEPQTFSAQPVQNTAAQPQTVQQAQPVMQVQTNAVQPQQIAQSPTANSSNNDWMAEYARRFKENVERAKESTSFNTVTQCINDINPLYAIGYAYSMLNNAKKEMEKKNVINSDNYYHRLGMCDASQIGGNGYLAGLGLGVLKELYDFIVKTKDGIPVKDILSDSYKDMKNNIEGANYGLNNPDKSCYKWLENLDINDNTWKK